MDVATLANCVRSISKKETNIPVSGRDVRDLGFILSSAKKLSVKLFNPPDSLFPCISGGFTVLLPQEFAKDKNQSITASLLQQLV